MMCHHAVNSMQECPRHKLGAHTSNNISYMESLSFLPEKLPVYLSFPAKAGENRMTAGKGYFFFAIRSTKKAAVVHNEGVSGPKPPNQTKIARKPLWRWFHVWS